MTVKEKLYQAKLHTFHLYRVLLKGKGKVWSRQGLGQVKGRLMRGQCKLEAINVRSIARQVQGKVKTRSGQVHGKVNARSRRGLGKVEARSRRGQGKVERQGQQQ